MESKFFRGLYPKEIRVVVDQKDKDGCTLKLKSSVVGCLQILDEQVGDENWQRRYANGVTTCVVSIYDPNHGIWIEKAGVAEVNEWSTNLDMARDSFVDACLCWGIGRELWTAPYIQIPSSKCELWNYTEPEKMLSVTAIEYQGEFISLLEISAYDPVSKCKKIVFEYNTNNN